MPQPVLPDWIIRRDGSADEVLTKTGTWGEISDAQWFPSQQEALAAEVPAGTTGSPQQQDTEGHAAGSLRATRFREAGLVRVTSGRWGTLARMPARRRDPWPLLLAREARTAPELATFMATAGPLVLRPRGATASGHRAPRARRRRRVDDPAALVPRSPRLPDRRLGAGHQSRLRRHGARRARRRPRRGPRARRRAGQPRRVEPRRRPRHRAGAAPPCRHPQHRHARQSARSAARPADRRADDVDLQPVRRHRAVAGVAAAGGAAIARTSRSAAATSGSATTPPCSSSSPTGWPNRGTRGAASNHHRGPGGGSRRRRRRDGGAGSTRVDDDG